MALATRGAKTYIRFTREAGVTGGNGDALGELGGKREYKSLPLSLALAESLRHLQLRLMSVSTSGNHAMLADLQGQVFIASDVLELPCIRLAMDYDLAPSFVKLVVNEDYETGFTVLTLWSLRLLDLVGAIDTLQRHASAHSDETACKSRGKKKRKLSD
jgi:hypothetical protein